MSGNPFNTNAPKITKEFSDQILGSIKSLRKSVDYLEKLLEQRPSREIVPICTVEHIIKDALAIQVNVSRINGAVLVESLD